MVFRIMALLSRVFDLCYARRAVVFSMVAVVSTVDCLFTGTELCHSFVPVCDMYVCTGTLVTYMYIVYLPWIKC